MQFNLRIHLSRTETEEKNSKADLSEYKKFIQQVFEFKKYLPELNEGEGKAGASITTIKHNYDFLRKKFPQASSDFFMKLCDEFNFLLREITEEMIAKVEAQKRKREQVNSRTTEADDSTRKACYDELIAKYRKNKSWKLNSSSLFNSQETVKDSSSQSKVRELKFLQIFKESQSQVETRRWSASFEDCNKTAKERDADPLFEVGDKLIAKVNAH